MSWPITLHLLVPTTGELREQEITLRPLRYRDRNKWLQVRMVNRDWLKQWEATSPFHSERDLPSYFEMVNFHNREGRAGRAISLGMWFGSNLIGQITMGGISYGALRGAHIGYWIDQRYANKGITTNVVTHLTNYGFSVLKLHRIEIALRPENGASRRVAEKAGYVLEGSRPSYLHIDGAWRDHLVFVRFNSDNPD